MKVGDLVEVVKSDSFPYTLEGKRGLITELIYHTRYSTAKPKAVPSAIVLFATGTVIIPIDSLDNISET